MQPSSEDLHPRTGARFVFEREGEGAPAGEDSVYALTIYMPEQRSWVGTLRWVEGAATLAPALDEGADEALRWAHAEALKLARVLRRDPRQHMLRWRGEAS